MPATPVNTATAYLISFTNPVTLPATSLTAGNVIVVAVRASSSGHSTGVTDTAGNLYRLAATNTSLGETLELWYAENVLGHANNVVAVAIAGAAYVSVRSYQFSGFPAAAVFQSALAANGSAGTVNVGTLVSNGADQLIVAAYNIATSGANWTPQSGWTELVDDGTLAIHTFNVTSLGQSVSVVGSNNNTTYQPQGVAGLFAITTSPASDVRVSQAVIEILSQPSPPGRVTQVVVEVLSTSIVTAPTFTLPRVRGSFTDYGRVNGGLAR